VKFTRGLSLLGVLIVTLVVGHARATETAPPESGSFPRILSAAMLPAWPMRADDIVPSPRVTWGRLDNGLRYALLPNKTPADQVSIRLFVDAGSLHERDDERGYAHFVEHMAFNGTKNFPPGAFVKLLQHQGARMGAHINAFTNQERTIYKFDLPGNEAALTTGLCIFRDFADSILFESAEVERERGVIASEDLARSGPRRRADEAWLNFHFAGTRGDRLPIGTGESIAAADAEKLRAFYDAWYRPERMILVIVGAIDTTRTEQLIREQFSSLASRAPLREEPGFGQIASPETPFVKLYTDVHSGIFLNLIQLTQQPRPLDSLARRENQNALRIAHAMIARRLMRLREQPKSKISSSSVHDDWFFQRVHRVALSVGSSFKNWEYALATAEQELRRAIDYGFHETELNEIKAAERASLLHRAATVDTVHSGFLADELVNDSATETVFDFPDEQKERGLKMIDALTPARCQQALREAWGSLPPRWIYASANSDFRVPPASILTAYKKSIRQGAKKSEAVKTVEFAYNNFGPSGKVIRKEHLEDIDTSTVEFENGVRLNLKKTAFEKENVHFSVRVGTGLLEEPRKKPGLRHWVTGVVIGGLGKHTADEVRRAINGRLVRVSLRTANDAFVFSGSAISQDLPFALRLLTADIIDPGFRKEAQSKMQGPTMSDLYDPLRESAAKPRTEFLVPFLAGHDSRFTLPPRKQVGGYSFKDLRAWLKPQFDHGYLECTIVGDIDIDATIEAIAETLGATSRRAASQPALTEARTLTPPAPPTAHTYTFVSANRPATLEFHWPVRSLDNGEDYARLSLLMEILQERTNEKIREELGETYGVNAGVQWNRTFPALSSLHCRLEVKRDKTAELIAHVKTIVADLAANGITEDELVRTRAPFLKTLAQSRRTNSYWVNALDEIQSRPASQEAIRHYDRWIEQATAAELNALAVRHLHPDNLLQFTLLPVAK
jgi:zinc protease